MTANILLGTRETQPKGVELGENIEMKSNEIIHVQPKGKKMPASGELSTVFGRELAFFGTTIATILIAQNIIGEIAGTIGKRRKKKINTNSREETDLIDSLIDGLKELGFNPISGESCVMKESATKEEQEKTADLLAKFFKENTIKRKKREINADGVSSEIEFTHEGCTYFFTIGRREKGTENRNMILCRQCENS